MASGGEDSPSHRRNRTAQGIPLQTLHPNGLQEADGAPNNARHRRTLSDRGRALFRSSRQTSPENERRYAPIGEGSPSPPDRQERQERMPLSPHLYVSSPSGERLRIPDDDDEGPVSPVADRGAFQAAIGFAGLSFNAAASQPRNDADDGLDDLPSPRALASRATRDSLPRLSTTSQRSNDDMVSVTLDDGPAFFSPGAADEDDTQPLTDSSHLRPSILVPTTPEGRNQDRQRSRSSNLSVRFPPSQQRGRSNSDSRLGDDLNNLEAGHDSSSSKLSVSPSGRKRSLSPGSLESPFARTGTMLRKMSQRVVNLSHEPELVEQAIRRKSSVKTLDHEGDLPPIPVIHLDGDMANDSDGPSRSPASEKAPSPILPPIELPGEHEFHGTHELPARADTNPLRGKSLSIFSKDSKIRRGLLNVLVHPLTEPLILLLIIVQTVILAIDSAGDISNPLQERRETWGGHWTDFTLFAIFIVYTIETIMKIIVSGFYFNPSEYSTIDRSIGFRKAISKKANEIMTPHTKR